MSLERGDIVIAPFHFSDIDIWKGRPVLVVSREAHNTQTGHAIALMITGAKGSDWDDDIVIEEWARSGLKRESLIRFRLASVATAKVSQHLGRVSDDVLRRVSATLARLIT